MELQRTSYRHALSPKNSIYACVAIIAFPIFAQAVSVAEMKANAVLSLYGAIGFFGAMATVLFAGGFTTYMARLGTEHRVEGIKVMIWGVEVLFFVVLGVFLLAWLE